MRKISIARGLKNSGLHLALLASTLWTLNAQAGVVFEDIAASGTGCKLESLHGAITDEGAVLYFSDFNMEADGSDKSIMRTNCSLAIPVRVPANKRLVFEKVALAGVSYLGSDSKVTVSSEAFLAGGASGGRESQEINQGGISLINLGDRPHLRTACGNDSTLRVSASAFMRPDLDYNMVYVSRLKMKYSLEDC